MVTKKRIKKKVHKRIGHGTGKSGMTAREKANERAEIQEAKKNIKCAQQIISNSNKIIGRSKRELKSKY